MKAFYKLLIKFQGNQKEFANLIFKLKLPKLAIPYQLQY